jgi:hypothetical protein
MIVGAVAATDRLGIASAALEAAASLDDVWATGEPSPRSSGTASQASTFANQLIRNDTAGPVTTFVISAGEPDRNGFVDATAFALQPFPLRADTTVTLYRGSGRRSSEKPNH